MTTSLVRGLCLAALLSTPVWARAQTINAPLTNTGIIQTTGPEGGNNGVRYVDVLGPTNGNKAAPTFAVLDFNVSNSQLKLGSGASVSSLTFTDEQSNFSATKVGTIDFYLVSNTTAAFSGLQFQTGGANGGLGNQLGAAYLLGKEAFTGVDNDVSGIFDTFTFNLANVANASAVQALLAGSLGAANGDLRLVVTYDPSSPDVGASYAGAQGGAVGLTPPTLGVTIGGTTPVTPPVTPEPSSLLALLAGGAALGLALARRRGAVVA